MRMSGLKGMTIRGWKLCAALSLVAGGLLIRQRALRAEPAYRSVRIGGVPHVKQKPDFCGEACAEMYLRKLGKNMDQDYVFDQCGLDPALGRGCCTSDLTKALKSIGFKTGVVHHKVAAAGAKEGMELHWKALNADIVKGIPSIICMRTDDTAKASEHFRLVLGYDAKSDQMIYHEPAEDRGAYRRMKRDLFLKLWPLKYHPKEWTVIRIRLEPGEIKEAAANVGFTNADYAQHIMKLKRKAPQKGFTIVVQPPFVVIGDERPSVVRRRAVRTVKWAVDKLKQDCFKKDPKEILDIWLFKDKSSYQKHTREIFGERPTTPFGYSSREHGALIMNIATGGGTLVHEIVHPFVAANFPACPAWFNEGLGSLYEQCGERNRHIVGFTNWRLDGLQKAIRAGTVPSFKTLTHTTDHQFYNEDPGTNYAQARYLCYYLQEKGLLVEFYHEFVKNHKSDPTGYGTLKKVLGEKDMGAFKKMWEAFVLKLRFP